MKALECAFWERKLPVQRLHERAVDLDRFFHERADQRVHARDN